MDKDQLGEFVLFQIQRQIVNIYKRYIISTEDLRRDHLVFLKKLQEAGVSEELLNKLDYFTDEKYNYVRKKILDSGNEATRDLERYFELIEVDLNKDALDKTRKLRLGEIIKASKHTKFTGNEKGELKVKGKII